MTTNQTIDGVPRELAERFAQYAESGRVAEPGMVEELRALLDGPALELIEPVAPWFYFVECDDPDYSGLFNHESEAQTQANDHGGSVVKLWNVPPTYKPATQPQGETVPVSARWTDWSMVTLEVDGRHRTYVECGKPERPQGEPVAYMAKRKTPTGNARLDRPLLSLVGEDGWGPAFECVPLYAEQPAPVAVVAVVPKSECPNCLGDAMFGCDACTPDPVAVALPERQSWGG